MADKANITPAVIKWSRETAHMTLEAAASKLAVSPEKLTQWEAGAVQPTIRQAENMARVYERPFALFFLPKPPKDFTPLQDFRRKTVGPLTTGAVFIIREIRQRQAWIRDFYKENGEPAHSFVGRFSMRDAPPIVAKDILAELKIEPQNYQQANPIKEWIGKAEEKGIFISRTSHIHSHLKLDSEEFQGFAIADAYAPFIFINSDDWDAAQLFSLVHELAHIWIAQSGVSGEVGSELLEGGQYDPVEIFCNRVAANALLPKQIMEKLPAATFDSITQVYKTAHRFGVSSLALLVRSMELKKISNTRYKQLKADAERSYQDFLYKEAEKTLGKEKKSGGPNPFLIRANRNGHLFTRFVMDAYRGGLIQPTEASSLLNTPVNKFSKLEAFVYR